VLLLTIVAQLAYTLPVSAQDADRQRAVVLFRQGAAAYDAGRFEEAADLFLQANEAYPEPILLYNYARAEESLGELENARRAYVEYLATDPEDRAAIEARIRILDGLLEEREALESRAEEEAARAAAEAERAEAARRQAELANRPSRTGPVSILAGGGIVLAGGAVLTGLGQSRARSANDADRPLVDAEDRHASGQRMNRAGLALAGVGVAVLIAGVVWLVTQRAPEPELALRF